MSVSGLKTPRGPGPRQSAPPHQRRPCRPRRPQHSRIIPHPSPRGPPASPPTGALLLTAVPKRMLVVGGGIIGLEMATVYSTLGARIDVVVLAGFMRILKEPVISVYVDRIVNVHPSLLPKFKGANAPQLATQTAQSHTLHD